MLNSIAMLKDNIHASISAKQSLLADAEFQNLFSKVVNVVLESYKKGGRLYIAGNGGSAADAQHLAAEFVSKLAKDRGPLPAEALTTDSSILTAIGNDYGFNKVFSRQLLGKANSSDIFLAISTSGQSPNILEALKECKKIGVKSILFSGRDGGQAKELADYCLTVPGALTSTIQEVHILLAHSLCQCVEDTLFD